MKLFILNNGMVSLGNYLEMRIFHIYVWKNSRVSYIDTEPKRI